MGQAEYTFSHIDADIEAGGYSWAAFKAQQAAEFAMKSLLRGLGVPSFGHNLVKFYQELKRLCEPTDGGRLEYCSSLLDGLYSSSRIQTHTPRVSQLNTLPRVWRGSVRLVQKKL